MFPNNGMNPQMMAMQQQQQQQMFMWQQQQQQFMDPGQMPIGEGGELIERMAKAIGNRLHNMKKSYELFQEHLQLTMQYHQALHAQTVSLLHKISTGIGQSDISDGFKQLADLQNGVDSRLLTVSNVMMNELIRPAETVLTGGYRETLKFEEGFVRGLAKVKTEIYNASTDPVSRDQKICEVELKVANNLEILKGLERKVYINFLLLDTAVLDAQNAYFKAASQTYAGQQSAWTKLAMSGSSIAPEPVEFRQLIAKKRGLPMPQAAGAAPSSAAARGPPPSKGAGAGQRFVTAQWDGAANQISFVPQTAQGQRLDVGALREEVNKQYLKMPELEFPATPGQVAWKVPALSQGGARPAAPPARMPSSARPAAPVHRDQSSPPSAAGTDGKLPKAKALYGYKAANADELSFPAGAIAAIISFDSANWWSGIINGKTGLIPSNYLERL